MSGQQDRSCSPSGLLLIDKPIGPTSMQVCRVVRRRLVNAGASRRVKVGHGGTLDPLATGLLVVLVGRATKLCERVMAGEKRYLADVDLSRSSASDDHEGDLTIVNVDRIPARADVEAACAGFVGPIMQTPPAFSAMMVGGQRAYKLARAGRAPTMEPRPVVVHSIDLSAYDWPIASLDIRCGRGVYIRSLARDLGAALGVGGMLHSLRRTAVGPFGIDRAVRLDDVPDPLEQGDLVPMDSVVL